MSETPSNKDQKVTVVDVRNYFGNLFKDIFDLDKGVDKWGTIKEIKSKQSMSGANAWMLICSIMIASIGLNLNSQAVIIGAMLISPLMSPILGIGLGVGINDKDALYHALMHFGAAILIALLTSTLYFAMSPLDEFTPQIKARTEPTFLDILIAIFGGIAGIVSIARKDISTTLPGVAIATALMPPLCVTGYGIANGEWSVTLTSFYLFFLNSFFVAFATYVIIRHMKFPFKKYASLKERRKNIIYVGIFSLIMVIPSLWIFWSVYKSYDRDRLLKQFIALNFNPQEIEHLDGYKLLPVDRPNKLLMKVYGDLINEDKIESYLASLKDVGLDYIEEVQIMKTNEIDLDKIDQMNSQLRGLDHKLNTQLEQLKQEQEARQKLIKRIEDQDNFFVQDSTKFDKISRELKIIFPEMKEFGLAISQITDFEEQKKDVPVAMVMWDGAEQEDVKKMRLFIEEKFELDTLIIYLN